MGVNGHETIRIKLANQLFIIPYRLLQILDASGYDVDVLKFWTRGLNSDCCSHLRNAQLKAPSLVFATTR